MLIFRPPQMAGLINKLPDTCPAMVAKSTWKISNMYLSKATDAKAPKLICSLASLRLLQVIAGPTHTAGHSLDLICGLEDNTTQPLS